MVDPCRSGSEVDREALGCADHLDLATGVGDDQGVDLVVGAPRVVVEQHQGPGAGGVRQSYPILDGRVAEEVAVTELGGGVLSVVDEYVGVAGQA